MKKIFKIIGLIFKGIWKIISFIRITLINLIFLASIAAVYFLYSSADSPAPETTTTPSALVLNLSGPIVEQPTYVNPLDSMTGSLFGRDLPKENVLFDVVDTIRKAKNDTNITGLVLSLQDMPETSLTKLRYIAKAINEFKSSGKPVFAAGDFYNQSQYYLASYADKIFLAPDGAVLLKGYKAYSMYYKTLLEKLDVSTHIFRVGTYKSAVEPFLRDDMSDAAKQSASRWVSQLWGAYTDDVATNRQIDVKTLNPSMEEFLAELKSVKGNIGALSLKLGLVDELATRQQVRQALINAFGSDGEDGYHRVDYYQYLTKLKSPFNAQNDDIAVIVASGAIMDGEQPRGTIGGDTLASLLRQARTDDKVKAVVLRVDSPGGSAFASEIIRNEIDALKASGKPVVVSMSSLAASGGYWISMGADRIIAQPTTLTGSIGIFSVVTTFEKGLNKLGVYTDGVGTSPFANVGITQGFTDGASQAMQMVIEHGYHRFISLVSENRNMNIEQVDKVAQGRVWTGQDALERGLVDQIGDFDDAIDAAAQLANIQNYNLYWVEEPLTPAEQFFKDLFAKAQVHFGVNLSSMLPKTWVPAATQLANDAKMLSQFNDPKGQYAFCLPCQVE